MLPSDTELHPIVVQLLALAERAVQRRDMIQADRRLTVEDLILCNISIRDPQ